jgi:hypothetical protein
MLLLIVACCAVLPAVFYLDDYYYRISPRHPDPPSGRIYLHHVKTIRGVAQVYLTSSQLVSFYTIVFACPFLCLTGYALNKRWHILRNPAEHMPKKL